MPRTIFQGPPENLGARYFETRGAGTIKPGHLTTLDVNGKVVVHGTAGGYAEGRVAIEDGLQGRTVDDAYTTGELVRGHGGKTGDEYYMRLAAAAVAVVITDFLASAGDGTLKKATSTDQRLYKPLEAVDNSAGVVDAWILVRKL